MDISGFTEYMNRNCLGLAFTVAHDSHTTTFLDLTLSVDVNDHVKTCTYRKMNVSNTILHADPHHPKHIIKNIPVGEELWAKQNCSLNINFKHEVDAIGLRLSERHYPIWILKCAEYIAQHKDWDSFLSTSNNCSKKNKLEKIYLNH